MTSSAIKIVALIAMTIDHIGFHLVSSPALYFAFRSIGRIAMPLFCFFIAQGYLHTSCRKRYFLRLFGFALLLEFCLAIYCFYSGNNYMLSQNIFLTLSAGLACLMLLNSTHCLLKALGLIFAIFVALTGIDYGLYAILIILLFGMSNRFWVYSTGLLFINFIFIHLLPFSPLGNVNFQDYQWFSMFSLVGIFFYNGLLGKQNKTVFYLYYPLHILVIIAIKNLFL